MRLSVLLFFVASFAFVGCSGASDDPAGSAGSSGSSRAHELVEAGATLLDVRTTGEFASGHIDGAINIPLSSLASRVSEIPSDQPVVVYCLSGGRSASAASELTSRGYEVHDLGAMSSW